MTTNHLSIPNGFRVFRSSSMKARDPGKKSDAQATGGTVISRFIDTLRDVNDNANSVKLLVEEANERAKKPWNQRLPLEGE